MSAQETVFNILREIRFAKELLSVSRPILALDLVRLTEIHTHLRDLVGGSSDLLISQLKAEVNGTEKLNEIFRKVLNECNSYDSMYLPKQAEWDRLCSLESILDLVTSKAREEYAFRIRVANEDKNKWQLIYEKYNSITRLYNSMDCQSGSEKEAMDTINKYCEELYDLVGHNIHLDTINDEHDKAYGVVKEKWKVLDELNIRERRRAEELQVQICENVLFNIHSIVTEIISVLPSTLKECSSNASVPKKKGRPKNETRYDQAGIHNLKACFIEENTYNKVIETIRDFHNRSAIKGGFVLTLFTVLQEESLLKSKMKSCPDFAEFMRADPQICGMIPFTSFQALYSSNKKENYYGFLKKTFGSGLE